MNIQIGEKYKHFKGNEYEIITFGKHSETLENFVVYKALYGDGEVWIRPIETFSDMKIFEDGTQVKRFLKIG